MRRRSATGTATEHALQRAVFDWREIAQAQHPVLRLLHAIPNGAGLRHTVKRRSDGTKTRFSREGYKLKREGMTAGVPDVCLPAARGPYHGLYIEHKTKTGTTSEAQRQFIAGLEAEGYLVAVSRDAAASIELIQRYLNQGGFDAAADPLPPK